MDWIPKLNQYCAAIAGNRWDAEDLAQDVYLKIDAALRQNPDRPVTNAYLYRSAVNAWKDKQKRRSKETASLDAGAEEPASHDDALTTRELLEVLAERLTPRMVVVLLLMDVFDFTARETAELISSNEAAVQVGVGRARRRLRQLAGRYTPEQALTPQPRERKRDGGERLDFEALVEAFRLRDPHAIYRAYADLAQGGIRIRRLRRIDDRLSITFTDPDGNLFTVIA